MVDDGLRRGVMAADDESSDASAGIIKAIWTLLNALPVAERKRVQRQIVESVLEAPPRRPGDVLEIVRSAIPRHGDWSIDQVKKKALEQVDTLRAKDVYNAVGYLTRKGAIRRLGYGRYVTEEGNYVVTSDDFGGERTITEGENDD